MAKIVRKGFFAVVVGAVGAAVGYFFDPDRGRGRRIRTKDQVAAKVRRGRRRAEAKANYAQGRLEGAEAEAQGFGTPEPVDDVMLAQEVKAALSSLPFPTQDVTVEAVSGAVTLRGQVASDDEINQVQAAVGDVPGVQEVTSHLHLPDTPAPNKADAQAAGGDGATADTPVH